MEKKLELSSEDNNQTEICQKLQLDKSTVNRDIHFLRQQAQENLQKHIHEIIPEEYQKCMAGMKRNLKQTLEIAETAADPRTKLQARAIANDCYKYIMELTTNGIVVTDAIKYVQGKMDHLNNQEKKIPQDSIKEKEKTEGEGKEEEEIEDDEANLE